MSHGQAHGVNIQSEELGMVGVPVLLGWGSPAALSRPMPNYGVQATAYSVGPQEAAPLLCNRSADEI